MNSQQHYLGTITSSLSSDIEKIPSNKYTKMEKRLFKTKPTLVSCQYKPELLRKSTEKYNAYRQKLCICLLLVAKFYFTKVKQSSFDFGHIEQFSTTNLHGVFSEGFKLVERIDPKNGKLIILKNANHHNYSNEVNFITEKFLILENKASLHNGPALWKLKELDLDDIILVEVFNLVEEYINELNQVIQIFHDARFQEETKLSFMFLSDGDLDFLVDVIKIWVR